MLVEGEPGWEEIFRKNQWGLMPNSSMLEPGRSGKVNSQKACSRLVGWMELGSPGLTF